MTATLGLLAGIPALLLSERNPGEALRIEAVPPSAEQVEGEQFPRKHTLYLNFLGGKLKGLRYTSAPGFTPDNSAENESMLITAGLEYDYPAYVGGMQRALAVVQAVQESVAAYGIRVMYDERPSKTVPYTMAMVGGTWRDTALTSSAAGVAGTVDCELANQRHIVFAFVADETAGTQAGIIGQEAGHAWGLDHVKGAGLIMSYQISAGRNIWATECVPLCIEECGANQILCRDKHTEFGCPDATQNDDAQLLWAFGGPEPDMMAPEVEITAPVDGTYLPSGSDFKVTGHIADDYGGVGWKLTVERDGVVGFDEVDYHRGAAWNFTAVPSGTYRIVLEAEDHGGHVSRDSIEVYVGTTTPPPEDTETAGESGGGATSATSATGTTSSAEDDGGSSGSRGDGEASSDDDGSWSETDDGLPADERTDDLEGCGCASGPTFGRLPYFVLAGLGWRRTRRASSDMKPPPARS